MDRNRYKQILAEAGQRFTCDMAGAEMTVLHEDGLYRHIRFQASAFDRFDLITWPGCLTIRGGHGTYTFARTTDMFEFFRTSNGVNVDYWAEKLPDGRDSVKRYSEDLVLKLLVKAYTEHGSRYDELRAEYDMALATWRATPTEGRYPHALRGMREPVRPKTVTELRLEVADARRDGELSYEDGARRLLSSWDAARVTSDSWEWDLREYDYHFVWSCHAVKWGVAQYDLTKTPTLVGA